MNFFFSIFAAAAAACVLHFTYPFLLSLLLLFLYTSCNFISISFLYNLEYNIKLFFYRPFISVTIFFFFYKYFADFCERVSVCVCERLIL